MPSYYVTLNNILYLRCQICAFDFELCCVNLHKQLLGTQGWQPGLAWYASSIDAGNSENLPGLIHPPGNDHISHQTRKGNFHPQKCRLVGDMLVSRRVIYYRFIAGFIRFNFC